MALQQSLLASQFTTILQAYLPSAALVAKQLAIAYTTYAQAGQFGASVPTLLPISTTVLEQALLSATLVPAAGSPVLLATAWATGLAGFWIPGTPVVGPQVGVVNGCAGAALVIPPLTAAFLNVFSTAQLTASLMASAIHTATITTTATVSPPPSTVLPLL